MKDSKPYIPRCLGRVEIRANLTTIKNLLAEGYNVSAIHRKLVSDGSLKSPKTLQNFRRILKRELSTQEGATIPQVLLQRSTQKKLRDKAHKFGPSLVTTKSIGDFINNGVSA